MEEYANECGKEVNPTQLEMPHISDKEYEICHQKMVRPCHDAFIFYKGGFLLIKRARHPEKGELWPVGGSIKKGVPVIDSLKQVIKAECNLELSDIKEISVARNFFGTDPFGHGKGTDTLAFVYSAVGSGDIQLDTLHTGYKIVTPQNFTKEFQESLHPFVRKHLTKLIQFIR